MADGGVILHRAEMLTVLCIMLDHHWYEDAVALMAAWTTKYMGLTGVVVVAPLLLANPLAIKEI